MTKTNGVMKIQEIIHAETPRILVLFDKEQEDVVRVIADVLGQSCCVVPSVDAVAGQPDDIVVGLEYANVNVAAKVRDTGRTVVATHAIDVRDGRDEIETACYDYEYLYTAKTFVRRDLARYFGFVLGQVQPHEELRKKERTTMLSTTFADIRAALPNLDILTVGADAVELRVDLLVDPSTSTDMGPGVPGMKFVGEQVMLLRQRTELPIIFTTRCTNENGRFPMHDPWLTCSYLRKAIQWGCEYIDVELWLPEDLRRKLAREKGNSSIISAWHDFSGKWKWTAPEAQQLFREGVAFEDGTAFGDIVKMIAIVNTVEEIYELEYFRSLVQSQYPRPPFSGLGMSQAGKLSRLLNKVFTPCTHPLLPLIAAPGQLSAAEINHRLHMMGSLPRLDLYAIGQVHASGQATFIEKCLNELSLPHHLLCVEHLPPGALEPFAYQANFGGAYLNPPIATSTASLPDVSEAARAIGLVDTVVVRGRPGSGTSPRHLSGDNATWRAIRAALTRDFVPSAYARRPALLVAQSDAQAAPAVYALTSLGIGHIYTIGFQWRRSKVGSSDSAADSACGVGSDGLGESNVRRVYGIDDLKHLDDPFVIVSALPADKSLVVSPLLRHYGDRHCGVNGQARVFVDLSNGIRGRGDSVAIAVDHGWSAYGIADVNAHITVETVKMLVGQNVGLDFVRLASGRSLFI